MKLYLVLVSLFFSIVGHSQGTQIYLNGKPAFHIPNCSVGVILTKTDSLWKKGTGFLSFDSRTVITAFHGVKNTDSIVYKSCGIITPLEIDTVFFEKDIAILRSKISIANPLTFGDYSEVKNKDSIIAIGYENGLQISEGEIIQVYEEKLEKYIRYRGYGNTGFSGGPVFNKEGHVIGITLRGRKEELAHMGKSEAVAIYFNLIL